MTDQQQRAAPGWYPDEAGDDLLRWWDGWARTNNLARNPNAPPPKVSAPTRAWRQLSRWQKIRFALGGTFGSIGALCFLFAFVSVYGDTFATHVGVQQSLSGQPTVVVALCPANE